MPQAPARFPPARAAALLPLTLLLLALTALAVPGSARPAPIPVSSEPGLWITLGADAFETLRQEDLRFRGQPLERLAEAGEAGVVMTRIRPADRDRIAALVHEEHHRCAGFVAHADEADARRALATVQAHATRRGEGGTVPFAVDQPDWVAALSAEVSEATILDTIDTLSNDFPNRYYQHPSGVVAAEHIRDLWQGFVTAAERQDVTVELYDHPGWAQPSVVATIPGSLLPEQVVVLGGHLDSTLFIGTGNPNFRGPGADDNASGIAVLTGALRAAMVTGFQPQRTVKIMGYAAEEAGLLGSKAIAAAHRQADVDVVGVLQFDMTAYHGSVEDMAFHGDFTNGPLTEFLGALVDTYQPELVRTSTLCGYGCSDHAAWHLEGYPAAMPAEAVFGEHNTALHTSSDTLATLGNSAAHAIKFARLAVAFLVETSLDLDPSLFADDFELGTVEGWSEVVGVP